MKRPLFLFGSLALIACVVTIVQAQVIFPDDSEQTTAYFCVPAGDGTWGSPVAVTDSVDTNNNAGGFEDDGYTFSSTIDCSGRLHWVTVTHFGGIEPFSELRYGNDAGADDLLVTDPGAGFDTILGALISVNDAGQVTVTYVDNLDGLATPMAISNIP